MATIVETDELQDIDLDELLNNRLVLWNDDHNTFDHVIALLVRIVKHTFEQAEQCALIVHFNGKCTVKHGSMNELKPMKDLLIDGGLSVTIE